MKKIEQEKMNIAKYIFLLFLVLLGDAVMAQVSIKTTDVTCNGKKDGTAVITIGTGQGPFKVEWKRDGKVLSRYKNKLSASDLAEGNYTVNITDKNDCDIQRSFEIEEPEKLKIRVTGSVGTAFVCDEFPDDAWLIPESSGGTIPRINSPRAARVTGKPKRYTFTVTDKNGCQAKASVWSGFIDIFCSFDPNDILGPEGVDEPRWVSSKDNYNYTIRFENDPDFATAPAQRVEIRHKVDDKADPFSYKLNSFGWGNLTFDAGGNTGFYQERLDLTADYGFFVDVIAGLDVASNELFWIVQTIDPSTGLPPTDPQVGFLPINDTTTRSGEGFASFSVKAKSSVVTGDTIFADASIVFDINPAIETNIWANKIDAGAPTSTLDPLPDTTGSNIIELSWSGMDDPGGVGVDYYRVFVSENEGPFTVAGDFIYADTFSYLSNYGSYYKFYVRGVDLVGNEELKSAFEEDIQVLNAKSLQILTPGGGAVCISDSIPVNWEANQVDSLDVFYIIGQDTNLQQLGQILDAGIMESKFSASLIGPSDSIRIALVDKADSSFISISQFFSIRDLPAVDAGPSAQGCAVDAIYLDASGANSYNWTPGMLLSDSTASYPRVYSDSSETFYLTGTDVFGCSNADSVEVTIFGVPEILNEVDICIGDSIFAGGEFQTESGTYIDSFSTINGCDSIVTTVVNVLDPCDWPGDLYVFVDKDATGAEDGTSWEDAFHDVNDAIQVVNNYSNATEVWIAEGTYYTTSDNDRTMSFILKDSIRIKGGFSGVETDPSQRPISGSEVFLSGDIGVQGDSTDNAYHVVVVDGSCEPCEIDNIYVVGGAADGLVGNTNKGGGILVAGSLVLKNAVIEDNLSNLGGALYLTDSATELLMEYVRIKGNVNLNGVAFDMPPGCNIEIGIETIIDN